jgi:hypothetical protein
MAKLSKQDAAIMRFIKQLSRRKDADPSLKTDPLYWLNRMKDMGGLTATNKAYWRMRCKRDGSPSVMAGRGDYVGMERR